MDANATSSGYACIILILPVSGQSCMFAAEDKLWLLMHFGTIRRTEDDDILFTKTPSPCWTLLAAYVETGTKRLLVLDTAIEPCLSLRREATGRCSCRKST